jgi:hypothetical protein
MDGFRALVLPGEERRQSALDPGGVLGEPRIGAR